MSFATCKAGRVGTTGARAHRLGVRDRAALERDGPIVHVNHTTVLRTAKRPHARRKSALALRPPTPALAPMHCRLAPLTPLLWCRISPRRRTARCRWPWRARRRGPAQEHIAPPLGDRKGRPLLNRAVCMRNPPYNASHCKRAAGGLRVADATIQHVPMQRAAMPDATRSDGTMHCAAMQQCNA